MECAVCYRYAVGEKTYRSMAADADLKGQAVNGRDPLCGVLREMGIGERVPVAYDPAALESALAFPRFPVFWVLWQLVLMWGAAFYRTFLVRVQRRAAHSIQGVSC